MTMTEQHPITPPPELVREWMTEIWHEGAPVRVAASDLHITTQAARWGADQELEACCDTLRRHAHWDLAVCELVADRRPKPPSLKEQALAELDLLKGDANAHGLGFDAPAIRRALEALPDKP